MREETNIEHRSDDEFANRDGDLELENVSTKSKLIDMDEYIVARKEITLNRTRILH